MTSLAWLDWALCRGEDLEKFFPTAKGPPPASTRAICYRCAVRCQCLEYALAFEAGLPCDGRYGIWAATSPHERFMLDRARRRRPA